MKTGEFNRTDTFEFGKNLVLTKVTACYNHGDHITDGATEYFVNEEKVDMCDWDIDKIGATTVTFKFRMSFNETKEG